ncbi:universal stress protein [Virgibacillus halodenitrificans]|jgi:nucleotide-binding universal stress UspA family protein|uniref:Universal stress protein n=1 Tax=Virgibacillus halodenitrificans TaxID=1482 RepID=A0AAC9J126_VIRHA|nr:universal stress protein [Virgibacillus halodenitrificans]APC47945.1 universal stress protein [Virgibacillus halodenitrificans]MCG1028976.1 universal stress protein [Virgibacillus halodenitrificans]MCJ0933242.1 universal stress protein [Virgibacillus halodenitrificans]MEC2160842.1 universal stress protein [Virgibacillus halodenitrificans]MYL45125.1 universal stress protein [Virgibacillus halodenitrificans]
MFKRIVLAADGSENSIRSANYAVELANNFSGIIKVIYVVDSQTSKEDVLHSNGKFEIEQRRKEKIHKVEELLRQSGVEYEVHILHGEPGPTIIKFTQEHDVDCVVIGSRGLNKLQTMILGSVSHKVAKRVTCPVLIVK